MVDLFRDEALAAHHDRFVGQSLLTKTSVGGYIVSILVLFFLVIFVFVLFAKYASKERVRGFLEPDKGIVNIIATQAGTITSIDLAPGGHTARGERVISMSSERNVSGGTPVETGVIQYLDNRGIQYGEESAIEEKLLKGNRASLKSKLKGLEARIRSGDNLAKLQEQKVENAKAELSRRNDLLNKGFVTVSQVQPLRADLLEQQLKLQEIEIDISQNRQLHEETVTALLMANLSSESRVSSVKRSIYELSQQKLEYEAKRNISLSSPVDGRVASVLAKVGKMSATGDVIASIIPDGSIFEARLLVPTRAIGFVKRDQKVILRLDAFPYQRFGSIVGHVIDVERSLLNASDDSVPIKLQEPVYKVRVKLENQSINANGKSIGFREGMLLEADIVIDEKSLMSWLLDPFFTFAAKI